MWCSRGCKCGAPCFYDPCSDALAQQRKGACLCSEKDRHVVLQTLQILGSAGLGSLPLEAHCEGLSARRLRPNMHGVLGTLLAFSELFLWHQCILLCYSYLQQSTQSQCCKLLEQPQHSHSLIRAVLCVTNTALQVRTSRAAAAASSSLLLLASSCWRPFNSSWSCAICCFCWDRSELRASAAECAASAPA
jgi:hypothetical protein